MKIALYSAQPYDQKSIVENIEKNNLTDKHDLVFFPHRLTTDTVALSSGCDAVVIFVNDCANAEVISQLGGFGVKLLLLRCAGFDMVDLKAAKEYGITVLRVPAYSPYAVAEHAAGLMMALNRRIHRSYNRTREFNFQLNGLLGFDLHGKTVGVFGTGKIGALFAKICRGFGCEVLAFDVRESEEALSYGVKYVTKEELLSKADVISLHCPLFPSTRHLICDETIAQMKEGVMLINTSRGGLIKTSALLAGLKTSKIGSCALDVYEGEEGIFNEDHSGDVLIDDEFARLFTFPNVIVTGHQAYFTKEALDNIAQTTIDNITAFIEKQPLVNEIKE